MGRKTCVILSVAGAALLVLAGCSSSHSTSPESSTTAPPSTPSTRAPAPKGPAATLSGPITGGNGVFLASISSINLAKARYTDTQYFASGPATSHPRRRYDPNA